MKIEWELTLFSSGECLKKGLQTARERPGISSASSPEEKSTWRSSSTTTGTSLQHSKRGSSSQGFLEESKLQRLALPTGTVQTCCPRASTGDSWTSRNCSCSCHASYSNAFDVQIPRHWKIKVEADFSHEEQGSSSEITSESPQALEAQRHHLVQEAAAEMTRRDARSADVLSQLRSELPYDNIWKDQIQKAFSSGAHMRRTELRLPVLHPKLIVCELEEHNSWPLSRQCEIKRRSGKGQLLNLHLENIRNNARIQFRQITSNSTQNRN